MYVLCFRMTVVQCFKSEELLVPLERILKNKLNPLKVKHSCVA